TPDVRTRMQLRPVISRLAALSKRLLLRIFAVGGSKALIALCGLILLSFFLDWGLHLPKAVRAIHLALSLGVLGYVIFRHLLQPLSRKPSIDELALIAERADPGLNDQLISAIQLERDLAAGRAVESPELIQALIDDTVERLR